MERVTDGDTLPDMLFRLVVRHVGAEAVGQLLDRADQLSPPAKGVAFSTPDTLCALTVYDGRVSFRFGDWGPTSLSVGEARAFLIPPDRDVSQG